LAAREMAPIAKLRKVRPDIPFFVGHFTYKYFSFDKLTFLVLHLFKGSVSPDFRVLFSMYEQI
jgi:hypothetical protein